jgi:hypothetical protein
MDRRCQPTFRLLSASVMGAQRWAGYALRVNSERAHFRLTPMNLGRYNPRFVILVETHKE